MDLFHLIKKFFLNDLEEAIQNIEILTSIKTEDINFLIQNLDNEILFTIQSPLEEFSSHYEELGVTFYKKNISYFILVNIIEKLQNEIIYALNHKQVNYDEDEFLIRIEKIIQGLSKGYFKSTIEDIIETIKEEDVLLEIDINCYQSWYKKALEFLLGKYNNKNILIYEETEIFEWLNSFDFKLFAKACNINTKNEIILLTEKVFEFIREISFYKEKNDFKSAYNLLILLDHKMNILNNVLKNVSIEFLNEKNEYFFKFFEDLILFRKGFTYFLIFNLKSSNKTLSQKNLNKIILQIFKKIKEKVKKLKYDSTGIINNNYVHFLISLQEKEKIKNIFDYVVKTIEEETAKELTLDVPNFYLRVTDTENFSGLDFDTLKKIAFIMANEKLETNYYSFKEEETKKLVNKAKKQIKINKQIQKIIETKDIKLFFQPIVHIKDDKKTLEYCEILSRVPIQNDHFNMQEFINYIVEKNLTVEFDKIVFEKIIEITPNIATVLKGVSINIFPNSLLNEEIINLLKMMLKEFKKFNLNLILEITEYHLFEYFSIIKLLNNQYPKILKIALDDFGSGYSSFSTLLNFSKNDLLDIIKIDGEITKNILKDDINFEILKMALEITKKLNKKAIIEYIENQEIENKIKTITNDFYGQGYLYSKAIPLEELQNLDL